jgi:hypothetical protein
MSVFLGAIKNTNVENSKAFVEYKVKGKRKRVYFNSTIDAINFRKLLKKSIRKGIFRENFEDIKIKNLLIKEYF